MRAHGLVFPVKYHGNLSILSDEERINLTQVLVEQNAGRLPVVIGVNASAEENAARFAAHARTIGADAVIAMPPQSAQGDPSPALITSFYRKVSVAGRLPVFIQNHDAPVGTNMSADFVLRLCREIENVRYVKEESTPSTFKMTAILDGRRRGLPGRLRRLRRAVPHRRTPAWLRPPGCPVLMSPDVVVTLWNALEKGDETRAMQIYKDMAPLFCFEAQLNGCYKEVLYRRGVIACPLKRNGAMPMDDVASRYLNEIMKVLDLT